MKRVIGVVTAAALLWGAAGMVFAGGGQQGSRASGGKKVISLYMWQDSQKPPMQAVADMYEKATGVKVEITLIPYAQYWTKLQTSLPSENGPDVFWCNYSHTFDYYPAGLVEDLQPYVERDQVDLEPFPPALKTMYSYNGHTYGIPKDYDTIAVFYNKALFDAKGLAYPKDGWTWEDLRETAKALTDPAKGIHGFAAWQTEQEVVYPFVAANDETVLSADGKTFQFNKPRVIEALQFLMDMIHVDHSSPTLAELKELGYNERFTAGRLAMAPAGDWFVKDFYEAMGDNLGIAQIPVKRRAGNTIHGLAFHISAKSANKEAAWQFVKLFATREASEKQAEVVIPAYGDAADLFVSSFPTLPIQIFVDAAQIADPYATPSVAASAQMSAMYTMFEEIWTGADIQAAVQKLDAECRRLAEGK